MSDFESKISSAVREAVKQVYDIDADDSILIVETPRDPKMGDYSTSVAMRLSRTLHKSPLDIAGPIVEKLKEIYTEASSIEVVKPGFINFRLKKDALTEVINTVINAGDDYGKNNTGAGVNVLVEWVSATLQVTYTVDMLVTQLGVTVSHVFTKQVVITTIESSM